MKKILLLFNGIRFSESAFEFARKLHALQPALITGVFIPQINYVNLWTYSNAMDGPVFVPLLEDQEEEKTGENIRRFEQLCKKNNIPCRVHKSYVDMALSEIEHETRFADLLIISGEPFYETMAGGVNTEYIADALKKAECPVLVVPENGDLPARNILAYDGSASSVFAIKQFAYVLPELCKNETLLVHATAGGEAHLPDEEAIEELAGQHFKNLHLLKLGVTPQKNFASWLDENNNALLVSGSYGRSFLSQLVRKSFVTEVIARHKLPVFITHAKK